MRIQTLVLIPTLNDVEQQVKTLLTPFDCFHYQLLLTKEDIPAKMKALGAENEEDFATAFEAYIAETEPSYAQLLIEDGNYYNVTEVGGEYIWYDIGGRGSSVFKELKQSTLGLNELLEPHVCLVEELLIDNNTEYSVIVSEKTGWLDDVDVDSNWQQLCHKTLQQHVDFYAVYVVCKG